MVQLHPKESFSIVRQISDHTDIATYYVRAVVRNAKTDALLETVDLTDRGSQRFSKSWLVPADVSGQGLWISILTSVYTDSGYTTKSPNYGDEMETYLVQARQIFNPNYPIPVGADIDYKRIKKIIDESLGTIEKPEGVELGGITSDIKSAIQAIKETENVLGRKIEAIKMPKCEHKEMMKAIDNIEMPIMPEIPEFDYSLILNAIQEYANRLPDKILETLDKAIANLYSFTVSQKEELSSLIKETMNKNTSRFNKIEQMKKLLEDEMSGGTDMFSSPKEKKMEIDPRITKIMKNKN